MWILLLLTPAAFAQTPGQQVGIPCAPTPVLYTNAGTGDLDCTVQYQGQVILTQQSIAVASKTADQLVGQSVATPVLFQSDVKLQGMTHAKVGSSTITATTAGTYALCCNLQFDASAIGTRQMTVLVNGSTVLNIKNAASASGLGTVGGCANWYLNAGDGVTCKATHDGGAPLNVRGGINSATNMSVIGIGQ